MLSINQPLVMISSFQHHSNLNEEKFSNTDMSVSKFGSAVVWLNESKTHCPIVMSRSRHSKSILITEEVVGVKQDCTEPAAIMGFQC